METVWWLVNWERVISPIKSKLPIFNPVCYPSNNAAKIRGSTFLINTKISVKTQLNESQTKMILHPPPHKYLTKSHSFLFHENKGNQIQPQEIPLLLILSKTVDTGDFTTYPAPIRSTWCKWSKKENSPDMVPESQIQEQHQLICLHKK